MSLCCRAFIGTLIVCAGPMLALPALANPLGGPGTRPAVAISAADVVLLDFSASWCGPCRSMAPLIGEISAAGWTVRHVDVDREGDLVRRFGVSGVPCYVLLVHGQETGRINGATTLSELENLLMQSRPSAPASTAVASAAINQTVIPGIPLPVTALESPLSIEPPAKLRASAAALVPSPPAKKTVRDSFPKPEQLPAPATPIGSAVGIVPAQPAGLSSHQTLEPAARAALESKLMHATARLRVEDAAGVSWGTGTVIDCRQGEALILTCGHIFRDSQGKGRIEVDLFGPSGSRGVAGQVVSWDLKRDLALVSIFTEQKIEPVRVGGENRAAVAGEPVVTVGCNGGKDPTVHHSRVTAVDKYLGPANVQVAGQPVQGRSGGGLFGIDGTLIGVCNAADPTDNEGLFAALPTIHEQLDEMGLSFVYRAAYPSGAVASTGSAPGAGMSVPNMPAEMPPVSFARRDRSAAVPTASTGSTPTDSAPVAESLSPGELALLDHVRQHEGKADVICIVRPHNAPHKNASEVFVLQGADRDFVDQLSMAHLGHAAPPQGLTPPVKRADIALLPEPQRLHEPTGIKQ